MDNSFAFTISVPRSVFGKLGFGVFASVCRQGNSRLTFLGLSRAYSHYLDFRVDSPDLSSANSAMNCLADFRLNLIRNGFYRRHWHFGCIIKLSSHVSSH